jgi:putative toxin-antitoxin system antitoxin component (TIGR02293 family)
MPPKTAGSSRPSKSTVTEIDVLQNWEQLHRRAASLLGGIEVIGRPVGNDPLGAHFLLEAGIPNRAIDHLAGCLKVMGQASIEQAIGMSLRTLQRKEKNPLGLLSHEQAGRAWQFAELLTKATAVFGTQDEAEQWFERPAIGLNQKRPIDLLTTPAGVKIVEDHLERLAYGVYA